ncbi:MAG TPA: NADH-dependent [FeFe] hydrogenase, group A6 [Kiritimatiellia bacterium]|nr:NADH-dependent [FeFe] hydrogenase, group A6 [Kiritimatiellia bacterium]HPS08284.1 NADH-dependent [FeFe] hydrogenase, group A6 [Kiritimatiellia bacterium]
MNVTLNSQKIQVPDGVTILQAARQAGVEIPTLCNMEHRDAIGACRVCLVEVEGARTLMAACSTPVSEGMVVRTHSAKARDARRQVVEMLLSEHDGNCPTCDRSGDCELRALADAMGVSTVPFQGIKAKAHRDDSTPALVRDNAKCIKCRRCVSVCGEVQGVGALFPQGRGFQTMIGPAFTRDLEGVACVQCGQCAAICPVGAIVEKTCIPDVWKAIENPHLHVIVQTAPAIRAALGECFGYAPGTRVTGQMVAALRRLGFDGVFDTNFTADLTILEEGTELLTRLKKALVDKQPVALPMFTSCSPGWINFAEYYFPQFLPNISTCKSPQQMFGAVAKTYYAQKIGRKPEEIVVVSVMPCTAKKFEAQRPEMTASGVRDVDYVLTTRELAKMIKEAGIDFRALPEETMDAPLGLSSGAADIFANTGGVMEAALRTAYEIVTGRELPVANLHVSAIAGLGGVKEASLMVTGTKPEWSFLEGVELKIAVSHGLGNTRRLLEHIKANGSPYHFIEVMTCPGGCIGGGGQPRFTDDAVRLKRISAIYSEDESKKMRKSHENPDVQTLYREFLGKPLGEKSHHLLHTRYAGKTK